MRAFAFACALFGAGVVLGALHDEAPARPVVERAGYRVVDADFHAHTRFSDGVVSPLDLVHLAAQRGLDVVAVTEHNVVFPAKLARAYAERVGGPLVLVGEEVTSRQHHVLALGVERAIDARRPLGEVIADAHAQGGVVIAAHPTRRYWDALLPEVGALDGAELGHPLMLRGGSRIGRWEEIRDFVAEAEARGASLALVGDSDYHLGSVLGVVRTHVFVESLSREGVLDAIRARRTVVRDGGGVLRGPPELVAALEARPLPALDVDYGYRGAGPWDRLGRALGFFGLVGLFALGGPRGRRAKP